MFQALSSVTNFQFAKFNFRLNRILERKHPEFKQKWEIQVRNWLKSALFYQKMKCHLWLARLNWLAKIRSV